MSKKLILLLNSIVLGTTIVCAQTSPRINDEQRAPLTEKTSAHDVNGVLSLTGRLKTTDLHGSIDSPVVNVRIVITNETSLIFTYVSGWATFYDADGVRCGEGQFKMNALAPNEGADIDTPGLRLVCSPANWRIIATNLLTNTADIAKPTPPVVTPDKAAAPNATTPVKP